MVVFPAPKSLTIPLCFLPRPEVLLSLAILGAGAVVTGTESLDFRVQLSLNPIPPLALLLLCLFFKLKYIIYTQTRLNFNFAFQALREANAVIIFENILLSLSCFQLGELLLLTTSQDPVKLLNPL